MMQKVKIKPESILYGSIIVDAVKWEAGKDVPDWVYKGLYLGIIRYSRDRMVMEIDHPSQLETLVAKPGDYLCRDEFGGYITFPGPWFEAQLENQGINSRKEAA